MDLRVNRWVLFLGMCLCACAIANAALPQAQDKQKHVVSLQELNNDMAQPMYVRQSNEAAVRRLLSSEAGRQALKSANIDYKRVDKAVGQLSDEDLAKLAQRSRQAESDFAAGFLSPKHLAELILVIVVVVVIIVIV